MKFKIFPIPKYLRIKNKVNPAEIKKPRLELANMVEKVKRRLKKIKRKNPGRAKRVSGSMKYTRPAVNIHKRKVTIKVGRKFFLFRICSFLFSFMLKC
jgi:hypothetical protein